MQVFGGNSKFQVLGAEAHLKDQQRGQSPKSNDWRREIGSEIREVVGTRLSRAKSLTWGLVDIVI